MPRTRQSYASGPITEIYEAMMKKLLTTAEAAELLNYSTHALEAWRKRGGGPRYVKFKSAVRYRPEDIEAFIEDAMRANTSAEVA